MRKQKKWLGPIIGIILKLVCVLNIQAKPPINFHRLVDAIYHAEGGSKTKYPYGIKIKGKRFNAKDARVICLNTINNSYSAWNGSGRFIDYLSKRYCPVASDPVGNKNWRKNVRYFYFKPKPVRY